mmetsp:Transcript_22754/g.65577  ORF Transcript_22754/g.65577 Transcript_22754/m.65577 type:complete len:538 (-) Transcript_22754:318-1931(-)
MRTHTQESSPATTLFGMLRRCCSDVRRGFSAAESVAVDRLCTSHRHYLASGGFVECMSDEDDARDICAELLADVEKAAQALGLEAASRSYRARFSANYRALFPCGSRLYRVDVLETSLDQQSSIWVNGERFELSAQALQYAERLRSAWFDLGRLLERREACEAQENDFGPADFRAELMDVLRTLDTEWAKFECTYISELIAIEDQARQLVKRAVECERQLRSDSRRSVVERDALERRLVGYIARLNSVANLKRKGRDDLGYDILASARNVLSRDDHGASTGIAHDAARLLAGDIVASYEAMCLYLHDVSLCIERVDPHLCNNAGLAARLVEWEAHWEVGARYVHEGPLQAGLCDLVEELKSAQVFAPSITNMFEDFDVELFWVLPRLVVLFFAASPAGKRSELVRSLLPHHFLSSFVADPQRSPSGLSPELAALADQYSQAVQALAGGHPERDGAEESAQAVLVRRAVLGVVDGLYSGSSPRAEEVVEDLMRALERWSLELQRHCPQDWNQCSSVLVQCVTGRTGRSATQSNTKFQV